MNVLITGNNGYIGSFLIDRLHKRSLLNTNEINIVVYDAKFEKLNADNLKNIDAVVHLAGYTNAKESFNETKILNELNINKTISFIDLCKNVGIKMFIFPSTSSVYGVDGESEVFEDDDLVINPQSPYAEAKFVIEKYIISNLGKKTKFLIPRFGSVFGISKNMKYHTAINKFCLSAVKGEPLLLWKDNYSQERPYVDLETVLHYILFSLNKFTEPNKSLMSYWNNTYNVVSVNIKLKSIIEIITKIKPDVKLEFEKGPLVNQFSYKVSTQKLESTGFKMKNKIEETIRETIMTIDNLI